MTLPSPRRAPRRALRRSSRRSLLAIATTGVALAAALTGCAPASGGSATGASDTPAGTAGFPVTISNCGSEVTLDHRPERIVLVNNDALANVEALDAVDRIVAITAQPAPGLYDDATYDLLATLTSLSTEKNSTGGSIVSQESLLGAEPDLVIAPENAVDREALAAAGIALYTPTAYCADAVAPDGPASFERVWSELDDYGKILGEADRAEALRGELEDSLPQEQSDAGSAAAVYVSSGGVVSPYGAQSMVTPVFEAAGLSNVYADEDQRVFDVNVEDLASRDPQTVVVLYSGGEPQAAIDAFTAVPGTQSMSAVKNDRVIALPFPYTDPPSVLSVRGPAQLVDLLAGL